MSFFDPDTMTGVNSREVCFLDENKKKSCARIFYEQRKAGLVQKEDGWFLICKVTGTKYPVQTKHVGTLARCECPGCTHHAINPGWLSQFR